MNYNVEIIKKENYKISSWSGGKTTELYIYPKNAKYVDRNFDWRISAATVENEMSTFTNLPQIERHIMITEGNTTLVHTGKYKITLNPFEKDSFMGEWETKSFGKASDFNLMTSKVCRGNLDVLNFINEDTIKLETNKSKRNASEIIECFYGIGGKLQYIVGDKIFLVDEKDLFCLSYLPNEDNININIIKEINNNIKIIRTTVIY